MNHYETRDFYLAAFILASGIQLAGCKRDGDVMTFMFPQTNGVSRLLAEYYAMQSNVRPQVYAASIRNLKNILYSGTEIQGKLEYVTPTRKVSSAR